MALAADGGTRTASITGAMVAAYDAFTKLKARGLIETIPVKHFVAAISVGVYQGVPVLDLDYLEDSDCDTDMNVIMTDNGAFVEVQGTAEGAAFDRAAMNRLLDLAEGGIRDLVKLQKQALGLL
jgi:ribonuclease PH